MMIPPPESFVTPIPSRQKTSALDIIIFLLVGTWIIALSVAVQATFTTVNEMLFEEVPLDWTLIVGIGTAIYLSLIGLPVFLLAFSWKNLRFKAVYKALAQAVILGAILLPTRMAGYTGSQTAAVLQILGCGAFFSLFLVRRKQNLIHLISSPKRADLTAAALVMGMLNGIPWVLWGALGSPLDTILNIGAAAALGFSAALILCQTVLTEFPKYPEQKGKEILLGGAAASLVLLMLATTAADNNLNLLLAAVLPSIGWGAAALVAHVDREDQPRMILPLGILFMITAAFPMLFIDPDELAMTITMGTGELIHWASIAAGVTVAINLALTLIVGLALRQKPVISSKTGWRAAGIIGIALIVIYFIIGQPGFFGDQIFVILKDQPDVSKAKTIQNYAERRTWVYQTLTGEVDRSQKRLRDQLDRFGIAYTPYYLVNGMEVNAGPLVRLWLKSQPEVDRILDSPHLRPMPYPIPAAAGVDSPPTSSMWNLQMIGADRVWKELGVRGAGVVVGNSDTGEDAAHPELAGQYRGVQSGSDYNWYDPWNHTQTPIDNVGHGTHTLGTILGKNTGVAPDAQWIGCVNLARNLGNPGYYLDCMQFMLAPFPLDGNPFKDGKPELGAMVLNNSWGCPGLEGCDPNVFLPAVKALKDAGIFVEASAGNSGYTGCGSIRDPIAIYSEVFTTGAVDSNGDLTIFSSLGPVTVDGSSRLKPDLVAPGENVLSAYPGGTYSIVSGTSMAGPHTVGVVALMWSANPSLTGDIDQTEKILRETASPYHGTYSQCVSSAQTPNDGVGYGVLDAYGAVKAALDAGK